MLTKNTQVVFFYSSSQCCSSMPMRAPSTTLSLKIKGLKGTNLHLRRWPHLPVWISKFHLNKWIFVSLSLLIMSLQTHAYWRVSDMVLFSLHKVRWQILQRTSTSIMCHATPGTSHPGPCCPSGCHSHKWSLFLLSSEHQQTLFSSAAVWMCQCCLYIVCTLLFCQKLCSVASQPWQLESLTDKPATALWFLCSLLEVSAFKGGEYITVTFQDATEDAPISLWYFCAT